MKPQFVKLDTLTPDAKNANTGTARGKRALKTSLSRLGAGRSILVDKHGTVIAGNKTLESAKAAGVTEMIIVPTDGSKLVAVQRTDLDLSKGGLARELAYADNRVAELDLEWDSEQLARDMEAGLTLSGDLWTADELAALSPATEDAPPSEYSSIVSYTIVFDDQDQQSRFHAFLRMLARMHPNIETIGARLDAHLSHQL